MEVVAAMAEWGNPYLAGVPAQAGAEPPHTAEAVVTAVVQAIDRASEDELCSVWTACARASEHAAALWPAEHAAAVASGTESINASGRRMELHFILDKPSGSTRRWGAPDMEECEEMAEEPYVYHGENVYEDVRAKHETKLGLYSFVLLDNTLEQQIYNFILWVAGYLTAERFRRERIPRMSTKKKEAKEGEPSAPPPDNTGIKPYREDVCVLQITAVKYPHLARHLLDAPLRTFRRAPFETPKAFCAAMQLLHGRLDDYGRLYTSVCAEALQLEMDIDNAIRNKNRGELVKILELLWPGFAEKTTPVRGLPVHDPALEYLQELFSESKNPSVAIQIITKVKMLAAAATLPPPNVQEAIAELGRYSEDDERMGRWLAPALPELRSTASSPSGIPLQSPALMYLPAPVNAVQPPALWETVSAADVNARSSTATLIVGPSKVFAMGGGGFLPLPCDSARTERYCPTKKVEIVHGTNLLEDGAAAIVGATPVPAPPAFAALETHGPFGRDAPSASDVLGAKDAPDARHLDHVHPSVKLLVNMVTEADAAVKGKRDTVYDYCSAYELVCFLWKFMHAARWVAEWCGVHLIAVKHNDAWFKLPAKRKDYVTFVVTFDGEVPPAPDDKECWVERTPSGWAVCANGSIAVDELLEGAGLRDRANVQVVDFKCTPMRVSSDDMGEFFKFVLMNKLRGRGMTAVTSDGVTALTAAIFDTKLLIVGAPPPPPKNPRKQPPPKSKSDTRSSRDPWEEQSERLALSRDLWVVLTERLGFMPFPVAGEGAKRVSVNKKSAYTFDQPRRFKDTVLLASPNFRGDRPVMTLRRLLCTTRRFGNFSLESLKPSGAPGVKIVGDKRSVSDRVVQCLEQCASISTGRKYYDTYDVELDSEGEPMRKKVKAFLKTKLDATVSRNKLFCPEHETAQCVLPTSDMTNASGHFVDQGSVPVFVEIAERDECTAVVAMTNDDRIRATNIARKASPLPLPSKREVEECAMLEPVSPFLTPGGCWEALEAAVRRANNM